MSGQSNLVGDEGNLTLHSARHPVTLPENGLYYTIHQQLLQFGSQLAMVDLNTEKELTFSEVITHVERVAYNLSRHGVGRGDVFAVCAQNSVTYVVVVLALARLGAVFAVIDFLSSADELNHCLSLCQPKFLFTSKGHSEDVEDRTSLVVFVDGDVSGELLFEPIPSEETAPVAEEMNQGDDCGIMFSSGTSGLPKAVEMTQKCFMAQALLSESVELGATYGQGCIIYQPLSHLFGTTLLLSQLYIGAYMIIMPRFNFEQYLQLVVKYQIRQMQLVPPIMVHLAKSPIVDQYDISCVQDIVAGAAPVSAELEQEVSAKLGSRVSIRQVLGMTEACSLIAITPPCSQQSTPPPAGSVGTLAPNFKLQVKDLETNKTLGVNETGEIWLSVGHMMKGYINNPSATKDTVTEDGWLKTGDMGYYDENGYVFLVERIKEMIKYNAYQVAPAELEGLLLTHPQVADVGVIGIPDPTAGELPHAWVVPKSGASLTEDDIKEFVEGKVAPYMKLRGGVRFVTKIPKSPSGKILRRVMRGEMRKT